MDYIEVNIKKPLYIYEGSPFVNIRDKYLKQAKKGGKYLKITTPTSTHYTTAEDWIKTGKKLKEVFRFPDRPMVLWGNYAVDNDPPETADINADNYLENMSRLNTMFRSILKKRGLLNRPDLSV